MLYQLLHAGKTPFGHYLTKWGAPEALLAVASETVNKEAMDFDALDIWEAERARLLAGASRRERRAPRVEVIGEESVPRGGERSRASRAGSDPFSTRDALGEENSPTHFPGLCDEEDQAGTHHPPTTTTAQTVKGGVSSRPPTTTGAMVIEALVESRPPTMTASTIKALVESRPPTMTASTIKALVESYVVLDFLVMMCKKCLTFDAATRASSAELVELMERFGAVVERFGSVVEVALPKKIFGGVPDFVQAAGGVRDADFVQAAFNINSAVHHTAGPPVHLEMAVDVEVARLGARIAGGLFPMVFFEDQECVMDPEQDCSRLSLRLPGQGVVPNPKCLEEQEDPSSCGGDLEGVRRPSSSYHPSSGSRGGLPGGAEETPSEMKNRTRTFGLRQVLVLTFVSLIVGGVSVLLGVVWMGGRGSQHKNDGGVVGDDASSVVVPSTDGGGVSSAGGGGGGRGGGGGGRGGGGGGETPAPRTFLGPLRSISTTEQIGTNGRGTLHVHNRADSATAGEKTAVLRERFTDQTAVLATVQKDGLALQRICKIGGGGEKWCEDKTVVKAAVANNPLAMQHASDELKKDETFVHDVVKKIINLEAWTEKTLAEHLPEGAKSRAKEIANFVREQKDNNDFHYEKDVTEKLLNILDPTLAKKLAQIKILWKGAGEAVHWADVRFRSNSEIMLDAIATSAQAMKSVLELRDRRQFVLEAVEHNGLALEHAKDYKPDETIQKAAVQQNALALQFASSLQDQEYIVLAAVKENGLALQYASPSLRGEEEIMRTAILQNPHALQFADPRKIRKIFPPAGESSASYDGIVPPYLVDKAVEKDPLVLQFVGSELRSNKAFVEKAVRKDGLALQYADPELRTNVDIVSAAVEQNGMALCYATKRAEKWDRDPDREGELLGFKKLLTKNIVLTALRNDKMDNKRKTEENSKEVEGFLSQAGGPFVIQCVGELIYDKEVQRTAIAQAINKKKDPDVIRSFIRSRTGGRVEGRNVEEEGVVGEEGGRRRRKLQELDEKAKVEELNSFLSAHMTKRERAKRENDPTLSEAEVQADRNELQYRLAALRAEEGGHEVRTYGGFHTWM